MCIINFGVEAGLSYKRFNVWRIKRKSKSIDIQDLMETPSGRMEKKKCYWLNASYIRSIIE